MMEQGDIVNRGDTQSSYHKGARLPQIGDRLLQGRDWRRLLRCIRPTRASKVL